MRSAFFLPLSVILLPVLSGCSMMSVYEGGFDCPAGSGVGCKPISEVNEMVNQGRIPTQDQENRNEDPAPQEKKGCSTCKVKTTRSGEDDEIWWAEPLWLESFSLKHMRGFPSC